MTPTNTMAMGLLINLLIVALVLNLAFGLSFASDKSQQLITQLLLLNQFQNLLLFN